MTLPQKSSNLPTLSSKEKTKTNERIVVFPKDYVKHHSSTRLNNPFFRQKKDFIKEKANNETP